MAYSKLNNFVPYNNDISKSAVWGGDEFSILNSALVIHVIYISCSILFCQLYSCACMLIDIHIFIMSCSIFIVFGSTPN